MKSSRIDIDDDILAFLKEHAEPFVDTPSTVLRRLLGMPSVDGSGPAEVTLEDEFPAAERSRAGGQRSGQRRRRRRKARAQTGTILPHDEYELPILEILESHAGRAPTREVLDELAVRLADRLMPADFERLDTGNVRWRNRAQFVRLRLIDRGDMATGSPRGVWEITDQGRERLAVK
jgi:Mrr N-terminal domain/SeqA protein N-terminal domain